jgi:hypothetical protein
MRRSVTGCSSVLLVTVAVWGCVPAATVEPSATPLATASTGTRSMLPTGSPGSSHPAEVPAGLPVMPGAEAVDAQPAEPGHIVRWMVDAIGPEVYGFYLSALPAAGFVVEGRFPGGNVAVIRFRTPDGTTLDLALVGEGDGERTRIDLRLPDGP